MKFWKYSQFLRIFRTLEDFLDILNTFLRIFYSYRKNAKNFWKNLGEITFLGEKNEKTRKNLRIFLNLRIFFQIYCRPKNA